VLLEGWERFDEPVDRIVAIGSLEHFGYDRYEEFFSRAYDLLPADGTMLVHCIVQSSKQDLAERNLPMTMSLLRFFKFIADEIFPGGRLPLVSMVEDHATKAGFTVSRVQPLQQHYAKTLDLWAAALEAHREEAIAIQSQAVYDRYMRYLTGCADLFRDGYTNVCQFTLDKSPSAQR
jgi:cyclopropane-fatty-acyl-phospholipid synthase